MYIKPIPPHRLLKFKYLLPKNSNKRLLPTNPAKMPKSLHRFP